ncbi:hypothetical protein KAR91_51440 [Candidatus Pacearchaeota archaeon]|nr:hypothetical protein [Candidatus Pacearchaeota archaeon]
MDTSKKPDVLSVTMYDGKYTVILPTDGGLKALRHGEEWRDLCGDGLVLALAQEVDELRQTNEALTTQVAHLRGVLNSTYGRNGDEKLHSQIEKRTPNNSTKKSTKEPGEPGFW